MRSVSDFYHAQFKTIQSVSSYYECTPDRSPGDIKERAVTRGLVEMESWKVLILRCLVALPSTGPIIRKPTHPSIICIYDDVICKLFVYRIKHNIST